MDGWPEQSLINSKLHRSDVSYILKNEEEEEEEDPAIMEQDYYIL